MTGRRPRLQLAALLFLAGLAPPSDAYTLEPPLALLRPAGSDSSVFFRLRNRERVPAAVEITIHEHSKDIDGKGITGPPADELFLVYPAQVVLVPGDEAAVQVRWIGDPALARERAFTLITREVAIPSAMPTPEVTSGVRIQLNVLLNYEARIYVRPRAARAMVLVESVTELPPSAGSTRPSLEVVLANDGSSQQDLQALGLLLAPMDASGSPLRQQAVRLPAAGHAGTGAPLLAGERRRLTLPRPEALPAGPVHVQLAP